MSQNKQIFIVDPVGDKAGMDYYSLNLAKGLSSQFTLTIFTNYSLNEKNIKCKNLFYKGSNFILKLLNWIVVHAYIAIIGLYYKPLSIIFHSFSYDFKDYYAIRIMKLLGHSVILILHDVSNFSKTDNWRIKKKILNNSSHLVVHNRYSFEKVISLPILNIRQKVSIINHGAYIDLPNHKVSKNDSRETLGFNKEDRIVLFFGQIKKVKGLDILLKSNEITKSNYKLVIAGKIWKDNASQYMDLIKNSVKRNDIKFINRYITNQERELFFKSADVIVLPYREIYQSGVLLMAMSYKIAVIASDLPSNKEIIENGVNGLLFEIGNPVDLSSKIDKYFDEFFGKGQLEERAYELMKSNYDWFKIAEKYIQLI